VPELTFVNQDPVALEKISECPCSLPANGERRYGLEWCTARVDAPVRGLPAAPTGKLP
jgi:hypothetical protein